ncbi:hypothetical protein EW146_g2631 [Bondarzewia mesenterica]|uniref:Ubiquitin 3 binding protein But2 C-terminal domain-containing protein n=1 Tax=Bondarzewia mesenterica TaxID=1095465 RepID=A0A4S4M030_9AGAM|nr:hypothetical protein EW146_g2631 [Bondarzewia mesenterica]
MSSSQSAEYEPLNPTDEDTDPWSSEIKPTTVPSPSLSPRIFWSLCVLAVLCILNVTLFPRTLSTRGGLGSPDALSTIGSSPGLDRARAKETLSKYHFVKPDSISSPVPLSATSPSTVAFGSARDVVVTSEETTIMRFTVPTGVNASAACSMAFFRPPITVTSELAGRGLKAVQLFELFPSSANEDIDIIVVEEDKARRIATLDLTRQAAMATSEEFACAEGEKRVFEVRCGEGYPCVIRYKDTKLLNIGFQLRRRAP